VRLEYAALNAQEPRFSDTAKSTRVFLLFGGISKESMETL